MLLCLRCVCCACCATWTCLQVVRKNFLRVYELFDEVVDYGFPQNSSTERLKRFIMMEPMAVKHMRLPVRRCWLLLLLRLLCLAWRLLLWRLSASPQAWLAVAC